MSERVPTSRLGRLARLAAVSARTSVSLVTKAAKGRDGAAEYTAEVLGNLRGLAAKVGQMASYVDGIVPEERRDVYEASLRSLRAHTQASSFADVRATLERELGADLGALFSELDETPVASASIGQVHRARLHDGTEVAVKVQHPRIREAVESDLGNAGILQTFAGLAMGRRFEVDRMLEIVRARFREELDFELEAERTRWFAELHRDDPKIRVPRVFAEHSSKSVLTTSFVRGKTFDEAIEAPEAERRAHAETLWRFVFKGNLLGCTFNADPHPGNYFFHEDGAVTFIDFGCVQTIEEYYHQGALEWHRAALRGDEAAFAAMVRQVMKTRGGALEEAAIAYCRACFEPLFNVPYRITRGYSGSLVGQMKDMAKVAKQVPEHEFVTMPAEMLFMNRLQFGFYSILARFDVEVDYAAVERAFLPM